MMEQTRNSSKMVSKKVLLVVIIIFSILFILLFGMIVFLKRDLEEIKKERVDFSIEEKENEVKDSAEVNGCSTLTGKYYGELINDNIEMRKTYTFKSDGTYTVSVENGGGSTGMYLISGERIYFFQAAGLGPSSEIFTYSYLLDETCGIIYGYEDGSEYKLIKTEN